MQILYFAWVREKIGRAGEELALPADVTDVGGLMRHLASLNHARAVQLAERLGRVPGVELVTTQFFNEFTLKLPVEARPVIRKLADKGVLGGISLGRLYPGVSELDRGMIVAVTETATDADFDAFEDALDEVLA
jgi:glycine dehydrogenase subunit 1